MKWLAVALLAVPAAAMADEQPICATRPGKSTAPVFSGAWIKLQLAAGRILYINECRHGPFAWM